MEVKKETEKQPNLEDKQTINQTDGKQLLPLSPIKDTLQPSDKTVTHIERNPPFSELEKPSPSSKTHTPPLMSRTDKFVLFTLRCKQLVKQIHAGKYSLSLAKPTDRVKAEGSNTHMKAVESKYMSEIS